MGATKTRFRYEGADGTGLAGFLWRDPDVQPRGVLQLAHGAGEHAGRYFGPLGPVMPAGWVIYTADHRGHGQTSGMSKLGDFGPGGAPPRWMTWPSSPAARGPSTPTCHWC